MFKKGKLQEYSSLLNVFLSVFDFAAAFLTASIAYDIKFIVPVHSHQYILLSLLWGLFVILSFILFDAYKIWRESRIIEEILYLVKPCIVAFLVLISLGFLLKNTFSFSFIWTLASLGLFLLYIVLSRIFLRGFLKALRAKGYNKRHLLLIASGQCGESVYQAIMKNKNSGYSILTLLSDDLQNILPVDGYISLLSKYLDKTKYDQIWIALPLEEGKTIKNIIRITKDYPIPIRYIPDIFGLRLLNHSFTEFGGLPLINLHSSPLEGYNKVIKRIEDLVLSLLILILVSPLMLLIAFIIKLTSPGPIIYKQTRIGLNNKPFKIMKFRSMPIGTEKKTGAVWAIAQENRATRFGSFLRKASMDELPQFINVLKGEMSIVGPRPERPEFIKVFKDEISYYMKKHFIKAGITGWAQVNGYRGNTSLEKRIEFDLYYIENWSLFLDLRIIFMTIFRIFKDQNAY